MILLINVSKKESKWFQNNLRKGVDDILTIRPPDIDYRLPTSIVEYEARKTSEVVSEYIRKNIKNYYSILIYVDVEQTFDDVVKREIRELHKNDNIYFANILYSTNGKIVGWRSIR